ncbi:thioredoxin reductase (NADPH) [Melghirimyces algeriensis]|uniref:Ferredoxin--NADP reductase n=1 Tax=Melghirimyces algeriensis TaxID=910412 RepID=A0A521EWU0_9BACL|nr:thioredoxin reductase (NADPH) [Melghirimyces algeriensis]
MKENECFDITIIGGGPAGLYSAFYSGVREMKTKIIECQPQLGGKIHIYPEKMIWDVGGLKPITGAELMEQLIEQGLTFHPEVVLNEKIVSISRKNDGLFVLHAASGRKHYSKTVIVAIGSGILKPQKLHITGAERFEVTNLHYTVKSLAHFKEKTVIISGGGNAAIDWANELEPIAKKVYVTHRKGSLSGHESQITQLINSSAECFFHTSITKLLASKSQDTIERVQLTNHQTGDISYLSVDEVLINHGFHRDASLLENSDLNIELVDQCCIAGNAMSESSIEGLYAAGDILKHEGKLNLIAGAFQDAANAVNKAKQYIQPDASAVGIVSSHNERFKQRNKKLMREHFEKKSYETADKGKKRGISGEASFSDDPAKSPKVPTV